MRKTIYTNICALTGIMFVVCTLFIAGIYGRHFYKNEKEDMDNQFRIMTLYFNSINDEEFDEKLKQAFAELEDSVKITILNADRSIRYTNNEEDYIEILNDRAISEESDYSDKLNYRYMVKLDNDDILIFSKKKAIIQELILFIGIISGILLITFILAGKTTDIIMKPITDINENIDLKNIAYDEFRPLFKRIINENKEKEKTEKIRREFSANVSHELKTPLTAIYGYAQMINNGMVQSKEDVYKFTGKIEKESSRLILLVNDIIKLSHLDENQMNFDDIEILDLDEMTKLVMASIEGYANDKKIRLYYSGEEAKIKGSSTLISELIYNLLDNAIKYNRENGSVDVVVGNLADSVEISVKDTGIGIADEDKERIFERFYRVDKSHSKKVGGTGLGLSIVKHIAMCHNAEITINSKIGEGTVINVNFKKYLGDINQI